MKKCLSDVMVLMICVLSASQVVYADVVVGPNLSQGPAGLARGLAIIAVIVAIIIVTWKIIQNMKKK